MGSHLLREQHTGVSRQVAGEIVWQERVEVMQNELCTLYMITSVTTAAKKHTSLWLSSVLCSNIAGGYPRKTKKALEQIVEMYVTR